MNDKHKRLLREHTVAFRDQLLVDDVLPYLLAFGVINDSLAEQYRNVCTIF